PGQREGKVVVRRAGDRPAEDVREQQHEYDRLDAEVDQLERVVLDLHQAAPGQAERLLYRAHATDSLRRLAHATDSLRKLAHAALLSSSGLPAGWARCPVRVRKTSSRLALRRLSSATRTPASSSRRTTAGSTAGSATGAVTTLPRRSGVPM